MTEAAAISGDRSYGTLVGDAFAAVERLRLAREEALAALAVVLPDLVARDDHRATPLMRRAYAQRLDTLGGLAELAGIAQQNVSRRLAGPDPTPPYEISVADDRELRRYAQLCSREGMRGRTREDIRADIKAFAELLDRLSEAGASDRQLSQVCGVGVAAIALRLGRAGYRQLPPSMRPEATS